MAVLAGLVGAGVIAAQFLLLPALIFIAWKNVVSPLTVAILVAALFGTAYTSLVRPGEELSAVEKLGVIGVGALAGGYLNFSRLGIFGGR